MVHKITLALAFFFLATSSFTMEKQSEKSQSLRFKLYRPIGYPEVMPPQGRGFGYDDVTGTEYNFKNHSEARSIAHRWGYQIYMVSDGTFFDVSTQVAFMYWYPSQKINPLAQEED